MADKRSKKKDTARELAIEAARLAEDSNCEDIIVLDLRGLSPVTDYFVIASGTSSRQMRGTADDIKEYGKSIGQRVWHIAGMDSGGWIILDFVDVVVHVFDRQHRTYYDLELIWGEGPRVPWRRKSPADSNGETHGD